MENTAIQKRTQAVNSGGFPAVPPPSDPAPSEDFLLGYCKHRHLFVSEVSCARCFLLNQSPRDVTVAGLTCSHRKHPTHADCVSEQIASPHRDGVEISRCMTVTFAGRGEVEVFVRYRICGPADHHADHGGPWYEIEEVCDDRTCEPLTLSDDELRQIEELLLEG